MQLWLLADIWNWDGGFSSHGNRFLLGEKHWKIVIPVQI